MLPLVVWVVVERERVRERERERGSSSSGVFVSCSYRRSWVCCAVSSFLLLGEAENRNSYCRSSGVVSQRNARHHRRFVELP